MGGYRAPLRIDLAGGWTDLAPYTHDHGGEVVNFTIDKWVTATPAGDGNVDFQFDVATGSGLGTSGCLLYTSPSPRDRGCSRMPSSA